MNIVDAQGRTALHFACAEGKAQHEELPGVAAESAAAADPSPIHSSDLRRALRRVLEERPQGVFNVAGPDIAPLSEFCRLAGRPSLSCPRKHRQWKVGIAAAGDLAAASASHSGVRNAPVAMPPTMAADPWPASVMLAPCPRDPPASWGLFAMSASMFWLTLWGATR